MSPKEELAWMDRQDKIAAGLIIAGLCLLPFVFPVSFVLIMAWLIHGQVTGHNDPVSWAQRRGQLEK